MKKILFKIIFIDTKVNKILQYCGNDIEGVAMNNGLIFDGFNPPPDMNKFLILIGSGSYLFNYLYFLSPREYLGMSYIAYLTERIEETQQYNSAGNYKKTGITGFQSRSGAQIFY